MKGKSREKKKFKSFFIKLALNAKANPQQLSGYNDSGIHSLMPEIEALKVYTVGLKHPVQ